MPLTKKDRKLKRSFDDSYGDDGKRVMYATLNKRINEGRPINVPESKRLAAKRRHHKRTKRHERKHRRGRRM